MWKKSLVSSVCIFSSIVMLSSCAVRMSTSFGKTGDGVGDGNTGDRNNGGNNQSTPTNNQDINKTAQVSTPQMSPDSGSYIDQVVVTITSRTPSAIIHYTLDGTDPTENSDIYVAPIAVTTDTILKAIGFARSMTPSAIATGVYSMSLSSIVHWALSGMTTEFVGYTSDLSSYSSHITAITNKGGRIIAAGLVSATAAVINDQLISLSSIQQEASPLHLGMVCYDENGSLCGDFGSNGTVLTDLAMQPYAVGIEDQGRIVVIGMMPVVNGFVLARYMGDGTVDNSFGNGGIVRSAELGQNINAGYSLALIKIGEVQKIIFVGLGTDNNGVVGCLNEDGSMCADFNNGTLLSMGTPSVVTNIVAVDGNKILGVGRDGNSNVFIFKLMAQGVLDTSFGKNGSGKITLGDAEEQEFNFDTMINNLVVLDNGNIIVSVKATLKNVQGALGYPALVCIKPNGSAVCDSFGRGDGMFLPSIPAADPDMGSQLWGIALQKSNGIEHIVGAGLRVGLGEREFCGAEGCVMRPVIDDDLFVAMFNTDGSPVANFGPDGNGVIINSISDGNNAGNALAVLSNGRFVAAGFSTQPSQDQLNDGLEVFTTICYNPDGSLCQVAQQGALFSSIDGAGTVQVVFDPALFNADCATVNTNTITVTADNVPMNDITVACDPQTLTVTVSWLGNAEQPPLGLLSSILQSNTPVAASVFSVTFNGIKDINGRALSPYTYRAVPVEAPPLQQLQSVL